MDIDSHRFRNKCISYPHCISTVITYSTTTRPNLRSIKPPVNRLSIQQKDLSVAKSARRSQSRGGIWALGKSLAKRTQVFVDYIAGRMSSWFHMARWGATPHKSLASYNLCSQLFFPQLKSSHKTYHFPQPLSHKSLKKSAGFHFQQIFLRLMRSTHASTRVNHGIETAHCRRDVPPPHILQVILSLNSFTTWERGNRVTMWDENDWNSISL